MGAFQSSYVNDAKVRVSSIQVIEFAKTFKRGISVNVLEHALLMRESSV